MNATYLELLTVLVGMVLPLAIDYFTSSKLSDKIKSLILPGLAILSGIGAGAMSALQSGLAFNWLGALVSGLIAWGAGVVAHVGLWKPTKASVTLQNKGIGRLKGEHIKP